MNTAVMDGVSATSPRVKARVAGLLYLLTILTGILAQGFVSGRLVVDGDAAASAPNILTHRGLFIDPMFILGGTHYLSVFSAAQLQGWRFSFSKLIPWAARAKPLSSDVRRHRDGGEAE